MCKRKDIFSHLYAHSWLYVAFFKLHVLILKEKYNIISQQHALLLFICFLTLSFGSHQYKYPSISVILLFFKKYFYNKLYKIVQ